MVTVQADTNPQLAQLGKPVPIRARNLKSVPLATTTTTTTATTQQAMAAASPSPSGVNLSPIFPDIEDTPAVRGQGISGYEPTHDIEHVQPTSFENLGPWTYVAIAIMITIAVVCASFALYSYCRPKRRDPNGFTTRLKRRSRFRNSSESETKIWDDTSLRLSANESFESPPLYSPKAAHSKEDSGVYTPIFRYSPETSPLSSPELVSFAAEPVYTR